MRVDTGDLVRAFQSNGTAFEDFAHDLVMAVGRSCGIDPVNIEWDYRTNVRDGGRDLIVKVPNPRPDKQFIPARRSIWSLKSGDAGIKPASLKDEVTDEKHPKVRESLQSGWTYVWCTIHPANHDRRDEMRKAADEVADDLKVDRRLFEFRWPEQLQSEVNLYPNVIAVHLPQLASHLSQVLSIREWSKELQLGHGWVDFAGRGNVVQRVVQHLLGHEPPNVLHIAGLSGIGKTRTVFEACSQEPMLTGVFYVERFDQVTRDLYRYFEEDGRHIHLVIDETSLGETDSVRSRLRELADRVRIVTIGPAIRQAARVQEGIIVLSEPETDSGVLEVVRAAGAVLSEEVRRSIAAQSGHDLRLALLLVRASLEVPEFRGVPLIDINDIWTRLMRLFAQEIGNSHDFRTFYEVMTASIDVGMTDDVANEIGALAQHFQHPVEHLRMASVTATKCGLGIRTRRFFEASPRALAARLFAERVWPRLQDVLEQFLRALPERLARRFLERCQDCTGPTREEVMARLGEFFLAALSGEDVTVLVTREASRLFQTWAEFDPNRGLRWLRRAVEHATPEQIKAVDGDTDGSGGWRGRRQLVWLCQNLASFKEHFTDCEAILFRLSLYETEPSIGNNSTAIWASLFWPILAGTEVPFDQRLPILLDRLKAATSDTLPLVLRAVVQCVEQRFMGWPLPPQVVGGRVVPPIWKPKTIDELVRVRRDAGRRILDVVDALPDGCWQVALLTIAEHVDLFTGLGLLQRLRTLFRPDKVNESLRRTLVAGVEQIVSSRRRRAEPSPDLHLLEEWLAELSPKDLATRVRDLTAQEFWAGATGREGGREERTRIYDNLASELVESPEVFRKLGEWLSAPEARSAGFLGTRIGLRDVHGRLTEIIRDWLRQAHCRAIAVSYLGGAAEREGQLSIEWAAFLDELAKERPEMAADATAFADIGHRGLERLLGLVDRLPTPASRFLRPLGFGAWLPVPGPAERARVAHLLAQLANNGDMEAGSVGIDLVRMWVHIDPKAMNEHLASATLTLACQPVPLARGLDLHTWREVLHLLSQFHPRQVAQLIVGRMTDPNAPGGWSDEENVEVLIRSAAVDPSGVMEVVGGALLDDARRPFFGISSYQGLFESIGLHEVDEWLQRHGWQHLRWLARHFPSPYLDETGAVVLPQLTDWLFRQHDNDQQAFEWFLMGRETGKVRAQGDIDPARKRQEMERFLEHDLRRVREWAEYEINLEQRQADFFRELDEEDERI